MPESFTEGPLRIPESSLPLDERELRFSLKYLDTQDTTFPLANCDPAFMQALLTKIKEFSRVKVVDFMDQNNNERRHMIDFRDTCKPNGFGLPDEQLEESDGWQFAVDSRADWRVHGFILSDTFYIVWLDPQHQLYNASKPG